MSVGKRLEEERNRLSFNQTEFAQHGGATRKTQYNYENGIRSPDTDYLIRLANCGVDVIYVLTGKRQVATLPDDESLLLERYRNASSSEKAAILAAAMGIQQARTVINAQGDIIGGSHHIEGGSHTFNVDMRKKK